MSEEKIYIVFVESCGAYGDYDTVAGVFSDMDKYKLSEILKKTKLGKKYNLDDYEINIFEAEAEKMMNSFQYTSTIFNTRIEEFPLNEIEADI